MSWIDYLLCDLDGKLLVNFIWVEIFGYLLMGWMYGIIDIEVLVLFYFELYVWFNKGDWWYVDELDFCWNWIDLCLSWYFGWFGVGWIWCFLVFLLLGCLSFDWGSFYCYWFVGIVFENWGWFWLIVGLIFLC